MMSWFDRLEFLGHRRGRLRGKADSVRRIALALDHLSPERGCFLAAFGDVLSRVAGNVLECGRESILPKGTKSGRVLNSSALGFGVHPQGAVDV